MSVADSGGKRSEELLVLYGSQTGNSEQAAISIANDASEKLSTSDVSVKGRHMQLDDFIEMERVKWPKLVVIVTSSYGVGQAPLGCYQFRKMCDAILTQSGNGNPDVKGLLHGVKYAMLGLGDSNYSTFFENPSQIDTALTLAGAKRIGPLGKADASGTGSNEQPEVISRWIATIWDELKPILHSTDDDDDTTTTLDILEGARKRTSEFCSHVIEDYGNDNLTDDNNNTNMNWMMIMAIVSIFIAILVMMVLKE